jgi:primosomal protein N' (replication factor Y) (superfamily II helicase)
LIQVSGRAGRAEKPGEVIVQTHHPDHPLLNTLLTHGYAGVAAMELAHREAARFPPYTHMLLLRAEAKTEQACVAFLQAAKEMMAAQLELDARDQTVELLGPMPAPMPRRAGFVRYQLLLNCADRPRRQRLIASVLDSLHALPQARKVRWSIDVDPMELY